MRLIIPDVEDDREKRERIDVEVIEDGRSVKAKGKIVAEFRNFNATVTEIQLEFDQELELKIGEKKKKFSKKTSILNARE